MTRYFIAGAGTGVGKTLFTCALTHQLREAGKRVRALKPVISGYDPADAASDTAQLLLAQGLEHHPKHAESISPWRFRAPLSPDMAAEDEGKAVHFEALVAFCKAARDAETLLIEGVGGVMVPLDARHTVLDWMAALGFPAILVTGDYLGALSHTLTAARAIMSAGVPLHSVVVSASAAAPVPQARTAAALRRFLPEDTHLLMIGRLDSSRELWKDAPDFGTAFFKGI